MKKSPLIDLLLDENFSKSMKTAIIAMFNSEPDFFVNTPQVKAKTINVQGDDNLLIVMRDKRLRYIERKVTLMIFFLCEKFIIK